MADNVDISPGSGATIAADDISGVLYQRVKVAVGADGTGVDWVGDVRGFVERQTLVKKTVDFTASQTAQTIWDPTGGTKFCVVQAIVSFSAAGALTVFDETDNAANRVFKLNGAANGGMAVSFNLPVLSATADNILKYTTGTGAAGSLTVFGYEV